MTMRNAGHNEPGLGRVGLFTACHRAKRSDSESAKRQVVLTSSMGGFFRPANWAARMPRQSARAAGADAVRPPFAHPLRRATADLGIGGSQSKAIQLRYLIRQSVITKPNT